MTLLTVLGAWFVAGLVATLVLGPRLRRAAEEAGPAIEPEPLYVADRSPLRWRLGTLGVIGLLAGSTGMAAAGALPGSTQTLAHHVLGTVGFDVPKTADAPAEVATAPTETPWSEDVGPSTSSPDEASGGTEQAGPGGTAAPPSVEDGESADEARDDAGTTGDEPSGEGEAVDDGDSEPVDDPELASEPSDVEEGDPATEEPPTTLPPPDPPTEEPPPTTTTPPPSEEPPPTTTTTTPPSEEPPPPSTTTTTTTVPPPPPPEPPPGA